ncbi:GNAT family N-acetyltransferase [Microbulbifer sp. CAU 1566]|uniref:GNAT family N-acetyltransferase n=1 Tax=Microbulbifer sp. CAU 1566 TaxID=2933269 RepID=UPI00200675D2|nr:GNAT family N-acetyltransferase [Microbulbifer sp. CAU 1566]MCK7597071.1 GNAT family N-acetyltransferase [Microbulbifer sp. CAU 1566]
MTKPTPEHHYRWSSFDQLTPSELYEILRARQEVFAVEQESIYQDVDGKDQHAWHLACWNSESDSPALLAYLRLIVPGKKYAEPSIGRVLTRKSVRGTGTGRELMRLGIEYTLREFPQAPIRISAQLYLKRFYEEFGFAQASETYDEDGIPHIEMLRISPK